MSDDVTIPRETARDRAEALREHAKQCPPMSSMAADLRAAADLLDPPLTCAACARPAYTQGLYGALVPPLCRECADAEAPPLTLAQEATVERLVAAGLTRGWATRDVRTGLYSAAKSSAIILDFAARDPLRLLAEHGTPLTEEPPDGTRVLVVPRGGGAPWVWHGFSTWGEITANGTVYRLGGAS